MSTLRAAFTLLEICLTLAIGVVLILLAVPSVAGLLSEQRLHDSYERFQRFADEARAHSLREQKPCMLVWDRDGIAMLATEREGQDGAEVVDRFSFGKDEAFHMNRPAALTEKAAEQWIFWPNGICEPIVVSYQGPGGRWRVSFDALTAHGTFLQSETL